MTKTNAASSQTWNQWLGAIYRSGTDVRRIVEQEVADHVLSAPCAGVFRSLVALTRADERRIISGVVKRLAKEHSVDKGLIVLSLRFATAVDRIKKVSGKHGRATVMSSASGLSLEQIIRLSKGSSASIHARLRRLPKSRIE